MTIPNVPQLRFPQFNKPWVETRLGDEENQTRFSKGKGISKADITENGRLPCVRYGELYTTYGVLIEKVQSSTDVPENELLLSDGDEVLIPASGETAIDIATATALQQRGVAIGSDINIIKSNIDPAFLANYVVSQKRVIAKFAQGNSVVHLYNSHLSKLLFLKPEESEQKRIVTFLLTLSNKTTKLKNKSILLSKYKIGVLQRIFAKELHFKQDDGSSFPEWRRVKINKLFDWAPTNNLSREKLTEESGAVQNIHYGDIHTKFSIHFFQNEASAPYVINEEAKFHENAFCRKGDIIIADASEDYADIGKAIEIMEVKDGTLVAGLHTYIARPKEQFAPGFAGYLFQESSVRKAIKRLAQGISVLGISKTNLEKVELPYPHPAEQKKITTLLMSIDRKIAAVEQQIHKLERVKQGLLQQMFV
jgi:type I restriction enzyme S subunit